MQETIEGFPDDTATVDVSERAASITVDETVYPLGAIYGAAYVFIDRCFVLLDRPDAGRVRVTLTARRLDGDAGDTATALRNYAGEFANELLACAWRHRINEENRATIEAATLQAIAGAAGPPSLEDLEEFDFTDEPFEDPLGIAMSWEDKYAKKKDKGSDDDAPSASGSDGSDAPDET